jgi:peptide/nickel transport system ATP-binding protein
MRRPSSVVRAVDDVSFTVQRSEMLALVGESGCGKTTTAQTVLRLVDAASGSILFRGQDITRLSATKLRPLRQHMQVVYQDPYESLNPRFRVRQIVEEPLHIHHIGTSQNERRNLVLDALSRVDLRPAHRYLDRFPHELSGGQRQRVAIAAALVVNPELLFADEPVSMLDVSVRAGIMSLLGELCRKERMGIVMITHDLAVAAHFADRIAVMYLGRLVESGPARDVLRRPQHPYTQALCAVAPRRNQSRLTKRRMTLRGEPGSAAAIPPGCRFHPRCPLAEAQCTHNDPRLEPVAGVLPGHDAACLLLPHPSAPHPAH